MKKFVKAPYILFAILVLAAILRIYHLTYKSISIDEAIGSFYAMEPFHRVFLLTINDVHPPLFYLVHHLWIGIFGMSESALRSISVVFGLLSIVILFKLGSLVFNKSVGLLAAFMLSISPWHIWLSQNARSNTMLLFLVLISTFAFYKILQEYRKKWMIVYVIVTIISIYTHYFAFMIWIAQNLYVLLSPYARRIFSKNWWSAQIVIMLSYFMWLPLLISQFLTKSRPMYKTLNIKFVKDLFDFLNPYAADQKMMIFFIGEIVFIALLLFGLYRVFQQQPNINRQKDSITNDKLFISKRNMSIFSIALVVLFLTLGFLVTVPYTLPLLENNINHNLPIYANQVKSYHMDQLHSFPISFFLAAIITILLFIVYHTLDFILPKVNSFCNILNRIFLKRKTSETAHFSKLAFIIAHIILPIIIAGIISLRSPYLLLRNLLVIFPPYLLIISLAIVSFRKISYKIISIGLIIAFASVSFKHFEQWMVKDDWRAAALETKKHIKSNDIILLEHPFAKKPFYYYGLKTILFQTPEEAHTFLENFQNDVYFVETYETEWSASVFLNRNFNKTAEWSFAGTTNQDDLYPKDGKIHVIQYQRKHDAFHSSDIANNTHAFNSKGNVVSHRSSGTE